jgi:eukaryotic-like serine/threonine-protein kinase
MPSPGFCSRCNRALASGSDSNLCPECRDAHRAATLTSDRLVKTPLIDPAGATRSITRPPQSADFATDPRQYLPESPPGYDLVCRLGMGGMGTVYLAHEHAAERTVAMKLLNSPSSPAAFDRFLVEARSLARLDHPNIVKVITVETNWREPFLTMEFADGGTLADFTQPDELLSPQEAARLILTASEAVAAAHAAGILHRDIKPSNILLNKAGSLQPKVSDFGLAKRTDRDDGLTRSSDPLGTPRYMSPEAAAGRFADIGPPSDVYGLGATLYHLLTGRPPFSGETHDQVIQQVLHDMPTRPRALRPDLSADLEAIVTKAMEKNPATRYPTAAALADDLRRFLAGQQPVAPLLSPLRRTSRWLRHRRKQIGSAAAVLALAMLLIWAGRLFWKDPTPRDPRDVMRDEIAAGKTARLINADGRPRWSAWPIDPLELQPEDGGVCSFNSKEPSVLLLLDDPGVDSYEVQAEICQKQKYADFDKKSNRDANDVGLVLAYSGHSGPKGGQIHGNLVIRFTEYDADSGPQVKRWFESIYVGLATVPGFAAASLEVFRADVPSVVLPRPQERPAWRKVSARVTPAGIWVPGPRGQEQLIAANAIENMQMEIQDNFAAGRTGPIEPFPVWSPRMAIGIWCWGSWVSVRNITVAAIK